MDLTVLERKKYNYLNEVLELTEQMGEVLDRNDQVSVQMVLAMRGEPILHLQEVDQTVKARRASLDPADRQRLQELLRGGEPQSQEERLFVEQSGKVQRLLGRVVELDKRLSLRMSGENSFYKK